MPVWNSLHDRRRRVKGKVAIFVWTLSRFTSEIRKMQFHVLSLLNSRVEKYLKNSYIALLIFFSLCFQVSQPLTHDSSFTRICTLVNVDEINQCGTLECGRKNLVSFLLASETLVVSMKNIILDSPHPSFYYKVHW